MTAPAAWLAMETHVQNSTKSPARAVGRRSVLAATPLAAAFAATPGATLGQVHADQQIVELCKQHSLNRQAFERCPLDADESPYWGPYEATGRAVALAQPTTLAGLAAKARIALEEATYPNGRVTFEGMATETWALDVLKGVVRLAGGVA